MKSIDKKGNIVYRNSDGLLHRKNEPAVECTDGCKYWYINGIQHRENGPVVKLGNHIRIWFLNGVKYDDYDEYRREIQDNFPKKKKTVKINKSGIKIKTSKNGTRECFLNGELHREDGPAVERSNGYKAWFLNGKRHREDGPASEYASGTKLWWINGIPIYSEQEYKSELRNVKINKLLK
jgi:hypothetical protein